MNRVSQAQSRFNASSGRGGRVVLCVLCTQATASQMQP
jgi:hypothetical protein